MRRIVFFLCVCCAAVLSYAQHDDIAVHRTCPHCGMDREAFGYSRMLVEYTDGTSAGTCSLHCVALELTAAIAKVPCAVKVADHNSRSLIDADRAYWVVGGDKTGVMTQRAKWAFGKKSEAKEFIKLHGGNQATFHEALRAAFEDLYGEIRATLERMRIRKEKGFDMCRDKER